MLNNYVFPVVRCPVGGRTREGVSILLLLIGSTIQGLEIERNIIPPFSLPWIRKGRNLISSVL